MADETHTDVNELQVFVLVNFDCYMYLIYFRHMFLF